MIGPGDLVSLDLEDGRTLYGVVYRIAEPAVYVMWEDGNIGKMTLDGSTMADARKLTVLEKSK